ncbi:zinc finger, CCHC-type containing protein [Tanacetum coccineum]
MNYFRVWGYRAVVRLHDLKLKTLGERGIECIFVGYAEHSKAIRFSLVPRPSLRIPNGTDDIGGSVVIKEDDPKTFDEAMKSQDVAFWKEATMMRWIPSWATTLGCWIDVNTAFLNGELEEEVYMNQPQGFIMPVNDNKVCKLIKSLYGLKHSPKQCHQKFDEVVLSSDYLLNQSNKCVYSKFDETGKGVIICLYVDDMLIFGTDQVQVDLTKNSYHQVSTLMDISEKRMPNNGQAVSQLEYSRVISCLMYAMTCTRPDIAFTVGKLSSGWVFLLGGGAISWASKKQTCITGLYIESEFVALAAAGKKAEWLRNLILEIPLWSKHITPISIRYDSAATLAKAYSQMYNGKSRHLGVRHNMIRELITNGVVSIEFVRSQQNLVEHLMKELARDLVLKSVEGMGLKSNQVAEC